MGSLQFPDKPVLLDGGLGRELRFRGVAVPDTIWSTGALLTDTEWVGGYANTFAPIPQDWELDGNKKSDGSLGLRSDLDPESYAVHAKEWLKTGATVVGGCCGTRPSHIAKIRSIIDEKRIQ